MPFAESVVEKVVRKGILKGVIFPESTRIKELEKYELLKKHDESLLHSVAKNVRIAENRFVKLPAGELKKYNFDRFDVCSRSVVYFSDKIKYYIDPPGVYSGNYGMRIRSFRTLVEAERFRSFMNLDLIEFLVRVRLMKKTLSVNSFKWVPKLDMGEDWTNDRLFEYFKITEQEKKDMRFVLKHYATHKNDLT